MKKLALYTSFTAVSLSDAAIFLTTTTYIQLAVAILFYLTLIYFAFKLFPRKTYLGSYAHQTIHKDITLNNTPSKQDISGEVGISDINKRAFLKLIGATGLSFFITSLITRRFDTLLGKPEGPGFTSIRDSSGTIINPAKFQPTDNYKISEVNYGSITYYGFIDQGEGWFIMKEDINAGTYRYIKGDTNFLENWNNRENLRYDYFNRVFPNS
jgi:hypothetical protein